MLRSHVNFGNCQIYSDHFVSTYTAIKTYSISTRVAQCGKGVGCCLCHGRAVHATILLPRYNPEIKIIPYLTEHHYKCKDSCRYIYSSLDNIHYIYRCSSISIILCTCVTYASTNLSSTSTNKLLFLIHAQEIR